MAELLQEGITRRQMLKAGGTAAAAAGYALSVETVLAQAIKTDTQGIVAGDHVVKVGSHNMTVYEARPESFTSHPILLVVSEIWGVHEYIKDCTRRFAKAGFHAVAPELFQREGDVKAMPNVQDVLKIVLAVPREHRAAPWPSPRPPSDRRACARAAATGRSSEPPGCRSDARPRPHARRARERPRGSPAWRTVEHCP